MPSITGATAKRGIFNGCAFSGGTTLAARFLSEEAEPSTGLGPGRAAASGEDDAAGGWVEDGPGLLDCANESAENISNAPGSASVLRSDLLLLIITHPVQRQLLGDSAASVAHDAALDSHPR